MADLDLELGIFIPWGCVYPIVQYPKTPLGQKWLTDIHPKCAEYWVIQFYFRYLKTTYTQPFALNEYINRRHGYKPYDVILAVMREKFGNVFGRGSLKNFSRGEIPASGITQGRARKPDILAFGIKDSKIHVEFIEVTTSQRSQVGLQQLKEKIDLLQQLKPEIETRLRQANEILGQSRYPTELSIHASTWRPSRTQLRAPLLRKGLSLEQQLAKIQWVCFKPTFREGQGQGLDGLILYEIHEVSSRQPLPSEIARSLRERIRQAQAQNYQLLPVDAEAYLRQNPDAARDIAIIAATAGVVAAIIIFIVIMPEIGIPLLYVESAAASGGAAALGGAETTTIVAGAAAAGETTAMGIRAAAQAGQFVRVAVEVEETWEAAEVVTTGAKAVMKIP